MKEKSTVPATGKTLQTDESAEKKEENLYDGLNPAQYADFNGRNEMRHISGLAPMTKDYYLANFGANVK